MYLYRKVLVLSLVMMSNLFGETQSHQSFYNDTGININNENNSENLISHRDLGDIVASCIVSDGDFGYSSDLIGIVWEDEILYVTSYNERVRILKIDFENCIVEDVIDLEESSINAICGIEKMDDYFWLNDCAGDDGVDHIYKYDIYGNYINHFAVLDGSIGVAWDGEYLWHLNFNTSHAYKVDIETYETIEIIDTELQNPGGLEVIDGYLWTIGRDSYITERINLENNEIEVMFSHSSYYVNITFDGEYLLMSTPSEFQYDSIDIEYEGSESGCTDPYACNYDPDATEDDGSCEYEVDECGICGGDNSSCYDCAGIPNGDNELDNCDICDDNPDNDCVQDCSGEWGGSAELDECGVCNGDGSTCSGSAHLEIQNVNLTAGTLDIYMTNDVPVAGFQFFISGITISNISGGVSADSLDVVVVNNSADCDGDGIDDSGCNLILGVDMEGSVIPAGTDQLLFSVSFTDIIEDEICFAAIDSVCEVIGSWAGPCFSDAYGNEIPLTVGDCFENDDNWVYGCIYETAVNYNAEATFDDGNCDFMWGDVNHDGVLTIQDLILIVNEILNF